MNSSNNINETIIYSPCLLSYVPLAELRGRQGRAPRSKFFHFWAKLAKIIVGAPTFMVGAPSSGKSWIRHCQYRLLPTISILSIHIPRFLSVHRCVGRCDSSINITVHFRVAEHQKMRGVLLLHVRG